MKTVKKSVFHYLRIALYLAVALFVLSLFVVPLLHPDHKITKVGVITNVEASGNPYFRDTIYTLTFQDGTVIRLESQTSVPIPVEKPVAITYSARENKLLAVQLVNGVGYH